jgi:hypothetical protein
MSDVLAPDALAVSCARCLTPAGRSCRSPDASARAPHPERVAAARLARDQQKRSESAWLELAEIWRDASEDDQRAILAVVKLRQALPVGIDGLVRVFEHGAVKHNGGNLGIAPGVTADDCAEHLIEHGHQLLAYGPASRDAETGELDASHAAARGVMVAQLVDSVQRGEVW